ncbi:hypothetical protein OG508_28210 [Streptomyces sp. NBC_01108]|uniref:hypothetical protein n=1 Tax=Streptomyces sp. NBC_01108 TaxID=2903751 RepID=UPI003872A81C|nr:hypothetical protein OG508_28210 [Streptomyces sp. NBC_01108]
MSAYTLPGGRQITGALTVKFGQQARGTGRWVEQPAAKYECLLCETTEKVIGAEAVTRFTHTIRTTHPATCPGHPNQQGAQAA